MRISRRLALGGMATLAAPALPRLAKAAEYTWKFGHTAPTSFPLHIRLAAAAKKIGDDSYGPDGVGVSRQSVMGDNDLAVARRAVGRSNSR